MEIPIMTKHYALIILLFLSFKLWAQDEEPYLKKYVLIAHAGKDYSKAIDVAKKLSTQLKLKIDLRGLKPNEELGLSDNKTICEERFGSFPCYVSRAQFPDGQYISIEFSDSYQDFAKGYYIVVVAQYQKKNTKLTSLLSKTKRIVPDAYIKQTAVYTGCMH
jgi:hypothetical protein